MIHFEQNKRDIIVQHVKILFFFKKVLQFENEYAIIATLFSRPLSQTAKTSPSHGEDMGSIPVGVTRKKHTFVYQDNVCFFQRNKSLAGFVKCTACVKYAPRVKCAAAREGIYFISHCDEGAIFHNSRSELFHIRQRRIFHLKYYRFYDIINSSITKNLSRR